MARIRKAENRKAQETRQIWKVGIYIRLSREDGGEVSESVVNQEKILLDAIPSFFGDGMYELADTYIDDGTSGTTDAERAAFQRMVRDVKAGRINCIVVKNLSRAFRNSANQGKFLEEFIPLYRTRFISLYQPRLDTFLDPEIVHSLEVGITGFMNEQYAYKTSCDVRRTFKTKREKGEYIGAFAPYGYAKSPENRNLLMIDEDAAEVVRSIYRMFAADGMSKTAIARRLNELGVPNPTAYKHSRGIRYNGPRTAENDGLWSSATISHILQNPVYIGTLQQGKRRMVSYKVHKLVNVPESEWCVVEDAVPPIVDRETYELAQSLHRRDTRMPPAGRELYLFSGFLRCADCGKGMRRHTSKGYVYYVCRTNREKSQTACAKHTIRLDRLERAVLASVQKQIELVEDLDGIVDEINRAPAENGESVRLAARLAQTRAELDKMPARLDGVYYDWKNGDISREQYLRLRESMEASAERLREAAERLEKECAGAARDVRVAEPYLAAFLRCRGVQSLTRGLLAELIDVIRIRGDGSVDIAFKFADQYRRAAQLAEEG